MKRNSLLKYKFAIIILLIISLNLKTLSKTPVTITGDGEKTKKIGEENGKAIFVSEIIKNPRIKYEGSEIRGDLLRSSGENNELVELTGNVVLTDKKNNSKVNAEKAAFYRDKNIIEFTGKPRALIKREDDKSQVDIQADIFQYYIDDKILKAAGNVKLMNNDLLATSETAVYLKDQKKAEFSGKPVVTRNDDIYSADEINYFTDKKSVVLEKNANILAYTDTKDRNTGKIKKVQMIATGSRFEYLTEKNNEDLIGTDVHIISKSENMEAFGKNFRSFKKSEYFTLWGNSCMIFKDANTGMETSRVLGDFMEYYQDIEELYVSGNVKINSKDGNIKGSLAKYSRLTDMMVVTGNAQFEKENSTVSAQSISINVKSNKTFINGDISGKGIH